MPNLSIKDVPEAWAEALRQRAARNHRSLQGELMAIIETAAAEEQNAANVPTRANLPMGGPPPRRWRRGGPGRQGPPHRAPGLENH
jgi:plasmid stability protein